MNPPPIRNVAVDATVLVNLCHVDRLDLLESIQGYEFLVPAEVDGEITESAQRALLDDLLARGRVSTTNVSGVAELTVFAELRAVLGLGESACIAIAEVRSWLIGCDDRRALAHAAARLGKGNAFTTPGLFVLAIRQGLLTVDEADALKGVLEACRFRMRFGSFAELLGSKGRE